MLDIDGLLLSARVSGLEGNLQLMESFHLSVFEISECQGGLK